MRSDIPAQTPTDAHANAVNTFESATGGVHPLWTVGSTFNGSTYDRLRGDVGGMLYQKPLAIGARRSPRRVDIFDGFENTTLQWGQAAGTVTRDTTTAGVFDGNAVLKLVTGAAAGNQAGASRKLGYQGTQKYVAELWWTMTAAAATTPRHFGVDFLHYDGTNVRELVVMYEKNVTTPQNKWRAGASEASLGDVTGGAEVLPVDSAVPFTWHYLRVHMDFSIATPQLTELHTDTLDLTGLTVAGGSTGNATLPQLQLLVEATTDVAAATTAYADNLTLSGAEV